MGFEPDLLLEEDFGHRLEGLDRFFLLLPKELLDGMAHDVGFTGGFGFGFDPEPGLPAWGIANVFHAILPNIPYDERGSRTVRGRRCLISGGQPSRQAKSPARPIIKEVTSRRGTGTCRFWR